MYYCVSNNRLDAHHPAAATATAAITGFINKLNYKKPTASTSDIFMKIFYLYSLKG